MACRITDDVIDSLQHCRLKAFLKLNGEVGSRCGYESLLIEQRANAQRKAIEKIRREYSETDVATHLDLSVANLRRGAALILGARLDDDRHTVVFDFARRERFALPIANSSPRARFFCRGFRGRFPAPGLSTLGPTARGRAFVSDLPLRRRKISSETPSACNEPKVRRSCC